MFDSCGMYRIACTKAIQFRLDNMFVVNDSDLSWAVSKALSIIAAGLAAIVVLAWVAVRKAFPGESERHIRKTG
jgi:hypothetical protein